MSKKKPKIEEPFSPEQLAKLEARGDKDVQLQRQKEGMFQRYNAKRDAKDLASQVKWKRRAGIALAVLIPMLLLLWIISWLMTSIGDLVITVDNEAAHRGIKIYSSLDGAQNSTNGTVNLSANMVNDVTNITYNWLPATLDIEAEGSHNGRNYLAYTFYLSNNGSEALDYCSQLKSLKSSKDAIEAARIMVYRTRLEQGESEFPDNNSPEVFAKRNITMPDGTIDRNSPEGVIPFEEIFKKELPGNYTAPTAEQIAAAAEEPQNKEDVAVTGEPIEIREFAEDDIVFDEDCEVLQPGAIDRYTIVMWIEGEDPECLDSIRDGFVKMQWFFNIKDEEL